MEQQLKSVNRNKVTGLDDLPPGLIKDLADLISAPLAHLIHFSLKTSIFPTDWKAAKAIPTHNSGAQSNPDNYRPISVLLVISKIIEKIIHRQLITFLDKNHLLTKFRFDSGQNYPLNMQQLSCWIASGTTSTKADLWERYLWT